jgi:tape measure domain-containing protein
MEGGDQVVATIDERIVSISFENSKFEANVARTMGTMDKLNRSIGNVGKGNPLSGLEGSANRVSFGGLTRAIDGIGSHLSTLQTTAAVAFGNIAAVAAQKLGAIAKSFTLDPITAGFQNYETQINAVQTILANTGLKGKAGLGQVTGALNNLNKYANLTVYNFSEMAKNIGTFTAAGVKLGPATESIKGIANLAALSGSSSEQASSAMYQLSQAIAAGKVGLQDWNSVVNAGIGGAVFQKSLIRTGQAMGTIAAGAVDIDKKTGRATINGKTFRESITAKPGEKSWLTSDVLVKTLGQFTGDLSKAKLQADGFNASQIKAIQSQAKTAVNAATQVKTFSQLMQALKEEVGSAWAGVFKTLFGNIDQAKTLFSGLHTFLEGALTGPVNHFNTVLQDWAKMGGRTELLGGLKQGFRDLQAVIKPIKEAFRDIFPPTTAKSLVDMTRGFKDLMDHLKIGPQTAEDLRRTFRGVFAVFDIGWNIVKDLAKVFLDLFHSAAPAGGGILQITGTIGDFLVKVDNAVKKGNIFIELFKFLEDHLKGPIGVLKELAGAIGSLFKGADVSGAANQVGGAVGGLASSIGPIPKILNGLTNAWHAFVNALEKAKDVIAPYLKQAGDAVKGFGDAIKKALAQGSWDKVFSAIQTGILAGILVAIKKALGGGGPIQAIVGSFKSVVRGVNEVLEGVTGTLKNLQRAIQVATLLEIAAAVGILTAALYILSGISPNKITKALGAVAVGLGEMVAAVLLLRGATTGGLSLPVIAGGIVLLSSAMVILALAMKIFATMSWEDIAKGLAGVAGGLAAVGLSTKLISGPNVIAAGVAMIPLATGLSILAGAMKIFATMSWEAMAKGLVGVGGGLTAIAAGMAFMPLTLPILGVGLIAVSIGLGLLAGAVLAFGSMSLETLAKGILSIGAALAILGLSVNLIPPTIGLQAAGLLILAVALTALSGVISIFGHMNIVTVAKGVVEMAGAIVILGLALTTMEGTLPGSVALLAAAAAFAILAPAMALMGSLDIGTILKGLGAMAGVLLVLGVAGAVAGPGFLILGAGILALGIGLAAVGGAVFLFAKGLSLLSDKAVKAMATLIAAVGVFLASFPAMVITFVKGLVTILGTIVELAPKIVEGLVTIAGDLLDGIIKLAPKIAIAFGVLVTQIVKVLNTNFGPILDAGIKMLETLLIGIGKNIGKVTTQAIAVVTHFLNALANNMPKLARAGARVLVSFLSGIANNIGKVIDAGFNLVVTFVKHVAKNLYRLVNAGGDLIAHFLIGIGNNVVKVIGAGTSMITHVLTGIQNAIPKVARKAISVAGTFIDNLVSGILALVNRVYNAVIRLMNGLAAAIRKNNKPLYNAGWNLASAIIDGAVSGLGSLAHKFLDKVGALAKKGIHELTHPWEILSPSKVTYRMAQNIIQGLINGLDDHGSRANAAMASTAKTMVSTFKTEFAKVPEAASGIFDVTPTITPVLDLSGVKKDAATLNDLIPAQKITAAISSDQAAAISQQQGAASASATATSPTTTVTLNQTNNSPEPLPAIEIYRQTKNQLAQAKQLVGA